MQQEIARLQIYCGRMEPIWDGPAGATLAFATDWPVHKKEIPMPENNQTHTENDEPFNVVLHIRGNRSYITHMDGTPVAFGRYRVDIVEVEVMVE